jgi:hypothetical protein
VEQPADHLEVFVAGQVLFHRRELAAEADGGTHGVRFVQDVVAGHAGAAPVRVQERGEDADGRGLPGAVGAQEAQDRPGRTARSIPRRAWTLP